MPEFDDIESDENDELKDTEGAQVGADEDDQAFLDEFEGMISGLGPSDDPNPNAPKSDSMPEIDPSSMDGLLEEVYALPTEAAQPLDAVQGQVTDDEEDVVSEGADMASNASRQTADMAADGIEQAGRATVAPLTAMDDGLDQSGTQALEEAQEMGPDANLDAFDQGVKSGKELYGNLAKDFSGMGRDVEQTAGQVTGFTSEAVRGLGDTAGDTIENAGQTLNNAAETGKKEEQSVESSLPTPTSITPKPG
ncbi:hypothetical protein [Legionella sp. W05-934-2]|uniref:hypothetical protein n=1 Tax=Legionella sp. W05-934-2 TaxID=1198649 RepID=UPI003462E63F